MPNSKLYDIPSLPDSFLKLKSIRTHNDYIDPNTVSNFMEAAIRDTGSDKPIFEYELPRQNNNMLNNSILSMQEFGSRYKRDPYHPELFFGDLTKDPRQSDQDPMVAQMRDQNSFRYNRYIKGKLQDSSDDRTEGMVGSKRMIRQVMDGYYDTATRLVGLFDDSFNGMSMATNPKPHNGIHTTEESIPEDQAIYEVQDEKILPRYSTDIVSKLNNNVLLQWQVQPDARYGLSSVSNVYRSKAEVDRAVNAVYRLGRQDTEFKQEMQRFKNKTTPMQKELLKAARRNYQETKVHLSGDSTSLINNRIATLPANVSSVLSSITTHAKKDQMQNKTSLLKKKYNVKTETLIEPITSKDVTDIIKPSKIPIKDKISIIKRTNHTHKSSFRNEDIASTQSYNTKMLARALTKTPITFSSHKKDNNKQGFATSNGTLSKNIDHIRNNKMTKQKYYKDKEVLQNNPTGSNIIQTPNSPNDFKFDIDPTMDNYYQTRKGSKQKIVRLSMQQVQDSEISPVNDTVAPMRTNYSLS